MKNPTLVELMEAGVHFGHKKERSHPQAKDFVFTLREGVFVIDLDKTVIYLEKAIDYLKKEINLGHTILFVGTKRQVKDIVKETAMSLGMPYVTKRFLGGTLTNFETIKKNLSILEDLENKTKSPEFAELTKKEKKIITDKLERLLATFEGVRSMKSLPDVIFVVGAKKENIAITEADKMAIPIIAICDTDADPRKINYPIPANDDAPKSVELIINIIKDSLAVKSQPDIKKEADKKEKSKTITKSKKKAKKNC